MTILLIAVGLLLLLLFNVSVNATLQERLPRRWILAAGGLVLLTIGLIIENLDEALFDTVELLALGGAFVLIILGISLIAQGRLRKASAQQAHGLFDVAAGVVVLIFAIGTPAFFASQNLTEQLDTVPTPTPGPTQSSNDRARGIFDEVVDLIAAETGLDTRTVAQNIDDGVTVSQMVRDNGGDLEVIVVGISEILTTQVELLAAQGDLNSAQAGLLLSQMELIVRLGVNQDLAGSLARFESNPLDEAEETATEEAE